DPPRLPVVPAISVTAGNTQIAKTRHRKSRSGAVFIVLKIPEAFTHDIPGIPRIAMRNQKSNPRESAYRGIYSLQEGTFDVHDPSSPWVGAGPEPMKQLVSIYQNGLP